MSGPALHRSRRAHFTSAARCYFFYFAFALGLGLLTVSMTPRLGWGMTAVEIARNAGFNDPSYFITGALGIARDGWLTESNYWLVRLWPPGFMVLEAALIRTFGEDAPLLLALLAISAAACAAWMLLLRIYLAGVLPARLAMLMPVAPFIFPVTPFFMLSPLGLAFGECFAISLLIAGFLLILLAARTGSVALSVAAGVALAASAYFRSQFELLVMVLTMAAVLATLVTAVAPRRSTQLGSGPAALRVMLITVCVAQIVMLPWRLHNYIESRTFAWVHTSDVVATNSLTPEGELSRLDASFVVEGGGHLACKFEPSYCGQKNPRFFYQAFLLNLGPWITEKAMRLPTYWLAGPVPEAVTTVSVTPTVPQMVVNLILLCFIGLVFWRLWRIRSRQDFAVQAWFQLSLYGCLTIVYVLAQLEARYFYLPKIFSIVALITLLPKMRDENDIVYNEVKR